MLEYSNQIAWGDSDPVPFESYEDDKGWLERIRDRHGVIVPHITKVDRAKHKGMYSYFYPPRIGMDFFSSHPDEYYFIPNLELGDVSRLIRVLEITAKDSVFDRLKSKTLRPFEIGLPFQKDLKRKMTLGARLDHLRLAYMGFHQDIFVEFTHDLSREAPAKLTDALKRLVVEYVSVISEYVMTGKVDDKYK